jgi:hypothetical protein
VSESAEYAEVGEVATQVDETETEESILVVQDAPDPELVLPVWEPTGVEEVDALMVSLHSVDQGDIDSHADAYTAVHAGLRDVLAGLDADRT